MISGTDRNSAAKRSSIPQKLFTGLTAYKITLSTLVKTQETRKIAMQLNTFNKERFFVK